MTKFREHLPKRSTDIYKYADFHKYKLFLRADFKKRCGYCNDLDIRNGGKRAYQIDHFVPQDVFDVLKDNDYNNLVYSCPYCNRSKWHKWPSNDENLAIVDNIGFVDPCSEKYEIHIGRNSNGEIISSSKLGQYMYKELNLGLKRHSILWNIDKLFLLIHETKLQLEKEKDSKVKDVLFELYQEQQKFQEGLDTENDI